MKVIPRPMRGEFWDAIDHVANLLEAGKEVHVLMLLEQAPMTRIYANYILKGWKDRRLIYVSRRVRSKRGGRAMPVYRKGNRPDAPPLAPIPNKDKLRKSRKKVEVREKQNQAKRLARKVKNPPPMDPITVALTKVKKVALPPTVCDPIMSALMGN